MIWRKVIVNTLWLVMAVSSPVTTFAQENPPFPTLVPITVENADQIVALGRVESPLPGSLAWLPDGRTLAAGTTEGVFLYDVYNLDRAPATLPAWQDVRVDQTAGVLISGGQWWDWQTGETRSAVGDSATSPYVYSPDRRQMATYTLEDDEAVIRLWEVAQPEAPPRHILHTGLLGLSAYTFHPSAPVLAMVGPHTDETGTRKLVRLWNYASDTLVDFPLDWDADDLTRFRFVHDGDYLLVTFDYAPIYGNASPSAYLLTGTTGELAASWKLWTPDGVTLNRDETLLAVDVAYEGGIIHVFDLSAGRETQVLRYTDSRTFGRGKRAPNTPTTPVGRAPARSTLVYLHSPKFSPDGRYLITAGEVSTATTIVLTWAVQTSGRIVGPVSQFDTGCCIPRFAFSPDDDYLWVSTQTGTEVHRFPNGSRLDTSSIPRGSPRQVGPFGLATFQESSAFVVWNLYLNREQIRLPHQAVINDSWSHAAYWQTGRLHIINLHTLAETTLDPIPAYRGRVVAFSPVSAQVVFSDADLTTVDLRDSAAITSQPAVEAGTFVGFDPTGQLRIVPVTETSASTRTLSADGRYLALTRWYGDPNPFSPVTIQAIETGEIAAVLNLYTYDRPYVAFAPPRLAAVHGEILTAYLGPWLVLWDVNKILGTGITDREEVAEPRVSILLDPGYSLPLESLVFSPDGRWLALGRFNEISETGSVEILDAHVLLTLTGNFDSPPENLVRTEIVGVYAPVFSEDGSRVAARIVAEDRTAIFDPDEGAALGEVAASGPMALSPDGRLLAIAQMGSLAVWATDSLQAADTAPLITLPTGLADVTEVAFTPDGTLLLAKDLGGVSRWGVPAG